jgi:hypothetical protein
MIQCRICSGKIKAGTGCQAIGNRRPPFRAIGLRMQLALAEIDTYPPDSRESSPAIQPVAVVAAIRSKKTASGAQHPGGAWNEPPMVERPEA